MIRVIDGKRYNTETAVEVADISGNHFTSDFKWDDTRLYRTKNGTWFIAGRGNAMSRWASPAQGGGWCPGKGLVPIGDDEAREVLERHNETAALEQYFGDAIVDA